MDYLDEIIKAILIPVLPLIAAMITLYVRKNIDKLQEDMQNEKINKYLDMLDKLVFDTVNAVNQTFVNSLKDDGLFTKDKQILAFQIAKNKVMAKITQQGKDILQEISDDFETMVEDMIESYVLNAKMRTK